MTILWLFYDHILLFHNQIFLSLDLKCNIQGSHKFLHKVLWEVNLASLSTFRENILVNFFFTILWLYIINISWIFKALKSVYHMPWLFQFSMTCVNLAINSQCFVFLSVTVQEIQQSKKSCTLFILSTFQHWKFFTAHPGLLSPPPHNSCGQLLSPLLVVLLSLKAP